MAKTKSEFNEILLLEVLNINTLEKEILEEAKKYLDEALNATYRSVNADQHQEKRVQKEILKEVMLSESALSEADISLLGTMAEGFDKLQQKIAEKNKKIKRLRAQAVLVRDDVPIDAHAQSLDRSLAELQARNVQISKVNAKLKDLTLLITSPLESAVASNKKELKALGATLEGLYAQNLTLKHQLMQTRTNLFGQKDHAQKSRAQQKEAPRSEKQTTPKQNK